MILILEGSEAGEYLWYLAAHRKTARPHFVAGGEHLDDEIRESKRAAVIRPQTSGPCVHIDQADDDDPEAVQVLGLGCRHPAGDCPHLETPEILCSVRDACYAMAEVIRMREACEAEQEEQDREMAADDGWLHTYEVEPEPMESPARTYLDCLDAGLYAYLDKDGAPSPEPEFPAPVPEEEPVYETKPISRMREWSEEEHAAIVGATSPGDAIQRYRAAFPASGRSDGAIRTRWHIEVKPTAPETAPTPTPDFVGDTVPVTQCDPPLPQESAIQVRVRRDAWSKSEDRAIWDAVTPAVAVRAYRKAFPASKRGDKAVKRRYHALRAGEDRTQAGQRMPWTAEEEIPIREATDVQDAVTRFRMAFPDSQRSARGIQGKFYVIRRARRSTETPRPKPTADPVPVKPSHTGRKKPKWAVGERVIVGDQAGRVSYVRGANCMVYFDAGGPARVVPATDLRRGSE